VPRRAHLFKKIFKLALTATKTTIKIRNPKRRNLRQQMEVTMEKVIPDFEIEAIARRIYPTLRAFYDSPEGQAAFEKWKQEQITKSQTDKAK